MERREITPEEFERENGITEQQLKEIMDQFSLDGQFFEAHHKELLSQYPDQYVAIFEEKVLGADKKLEKLVKRLRRNGIDTTRVRIEFLHTKRPTWILLQAA